MQQNPPQIPVMNTPRSVDLEFTSRCNLRCRYCFFFDHPEVTYKALPIEEWLKFIDELGQCSVMDVCLAGGEPFIRDDLPDLIEAIVKNRMRFSMEPPHLSFLRFVCGQRNSLIKYPWAPCSCTASKPLSLALRAA